VTGRTTRARSGRAVASERHIAGKPSIHC